MDEKMADDKSFIAKIEEFILKKTKPKYKDSQDEINGFLMEKSKTADKTPSVPLFKSQKLSGMDVFCFGDEEKSKNTILYVHGGAFVNEINFQHLLYCRKLAKKLDAYVIAPVYPLAPNHSCEESFDKITNLYKYLIEKHDGISLIGDSAGGGFILSFSQYIKIVNLPQSNRIIVFSPWVDISMSNTPYDSKNDPILGDIGLREIGKRWAGELNTDDYRVSPLFGDTEGLPRTLIFAGGSEIFYKDIKLFYEKIVDSGVDASLIVGNGLFHIYPMFPSPEARDAFKKIKKEFDL